LFGKEARRRTEEKRKHWKDEDRNPQRTVRK